MSTVLTNSQNYTNIANAIRAKGVTGQFKPSEMSTAISNIEGEEIITADEVAFSGNLNYQFGGKSANLIRNHFWDKTTFTDITSAYYFGYGCKFDSWDNKDIYLNDCLMSYFPYYIYTKDLPKFHGTISGSSSYLNYCNRAFTGLYYIRDGQVIDDAFEDVNFNVNINRFDQCFEYLYSLRTVPNCIKKIIGHLSSDNNSEYYSPYFSIFMNAFVLSSIDDIPVVGSGYTSNAFSDAFKAGLVTNAGINSKSMTFETNEDGTAKTARWKLQVINLSNMGFVGQVADSDNTKIDYATTKWNSGYKTTDIVGFKITSDIPTGYATWYDYFKAKYDAKKGGDYLVNCGVELTHDGITTKFGFSRYNHASAVDTINSLPDTSAYLAEKGGTNTIKFRKNAGAFTDEGGINDLTDAEIAVATAKGWTVTLVD